MKEMTFWDHVEELRKVIMRIVWILAIAFVATTYYVDEITEWLLKPIRLSLHDTKAGVLVYHSIFEKAWVQVDVSIWWAIMISSPFWFYQVWTFIRPGLHAHEARAVKPFMVLGLLLFLGGMAFGYYLALPAVFSFLTKVGVTDIQANINLRDYISTTSQILLFLGVIFQVPNILLILGFMGIVTKQSLHKMRRYIYVGLAIFAAIFSPPDVISMIAVWVPCCVLFEVGVFLVAIVVHPYLKGVHMKENK
ncbi:MAG: twin-arginine translocase subunit TatC [Bdellovibrionales bacterium]|nr:twin-arginine translocase subunit TatC [Bdellovibrionales bacterium]